MELFYNGIIKTQIVRNIEQMTATEKASLCFTPKFTDNFKDFSYYYNGYISTDKFTDFYTFAFDFMARRESGWQKLEDQVKLVRDYFDKVRQNANDPLIESLRNGNPRKYQALQDYFHFQGDPYEHIDQLQNIILQASSPEDTLSDYFTKHIKQYLIFNLGNDDKILGSTECLLSMLLPQIEVHLTFEMLKGNIQLDDMPDDELDAWQNNPQQQRQIVRGQRRQNQLRKLLYCTYIFMPVHTDFPSNITDALYKMFHLELFETQRLEYFPMKDPLYTAHYVLGRIKRQKRKRYLERVYNSHSYSVYHQSVLGNCQFLAFKNALFFEAYKLSFDMDIDPNLYYEIDDIEDSALLKAYYVFKVLVNIFSLFIIQHLDGCQIPFCFDGSDRFFYKKLFNKVRNFCMEYINFDGLIQDMKTFLQERVKKDFQARFLKFQAYKFVRIVNGLEAYQSFHEKMRKVRTQIIHEDESEREFQNKIIYEILHGEKTKEIIFQTLPAIKEKTMKPDELLAFYKYLSTFDEPFYDISLDDVDFFFGETVENLKAKEPNLTEGKILNKIKQIHMDFINQVMLDNPQYCLYGLLSRNKYYWAVYALFAQYFKNVSRVFVYTEYQFDVDKYPREYVSIHQAPAIVEIMKRYGQFFEIKENELNDPFSLIDNFKRRPDISDDVKKPILDKMDLDKVFLEARRLLTPEQKQRMLNALNDFYKSNARSFDDLKNQLNPERSSFQWYRIQLEIYKLMPKGVKMELTYFVNGGAGCLSNFTRATQSFLFNDNLLPQYTITKVYQDFIESKMLKTKEIPLKGNNANGFYIKAVNNISKKIGKANFWAQILDIEKNLINNSNQNDPTDVDHVYRVSKYLELVNQMCEKADRRFEEQEEELNRENLDDDEYLIRVANMREDIDIHSFDDPIRDFQIAVQKLNEKQLDNEDFTRLMVVKGKRPIHYILPSGFSEEEITIIGKNIFNCYSWF